jgi:nitroreductase
MDTWDAITARRNVREYSAEPLPPEDLNQVLEAARRAPSSRNAQWWDLVVVTDPADLGALSTVWVGAGHVANSPATVAVISPPGTDEGQRAWIHYDLGQMTMQLMIAAADLGIASCHSAVEDQDLARSVLRFPDDRECSSLISLGYPAGRPLRPIKNPNRRDFDDVVHRDRW